MTNLPDRQYTVTLVDDAQRDGARLAHACDLLGVSVRTYHRWKAPGVVRADRRPEARRTNPRNRLSESERDAVVALCNALDYRSRPPAYIVANQADQGHSLASESTFYRVLRDYGQRHHRGRAKVPVGKAPPPAIRHTPPTGCGAGISPGCRARCVAPGGICI